jgi:hypothetical protein
MLTKFATTIEMIPNAFFILEHPILCKKSANRFAKAPNVRVSGQPPEEINAPKLVVAERRIYRTGGYSGNWRFAFDLPS